MVAGWGGYKPGQRIVGIDRTILANRLVERYNAGESVRELANSIGRSYGFVHRMLTGRGVKLRSRGGARRQKKK